ncbi:hypothetical protein SNEBB_005931 [Seison nebaliae]|nr:hypothetical protein SNEBB_005931 [Seison nebaliae]
MPLDYSRWDHIDLSDDEDDQHPNIDKHSLNRWRHEARLQRMAEEKKRDKEFSEAYEFYINRLSQMETEMNERKEKGETVESNSQFKKLSDEYDLAIKEKGNWEEKKATWEKEKRLRKHNVDTLSKPKFDKVIINAPKKEEFDDVAEAKLSEEEQHKVFEKFIEKNGERIKKLGMLKKPMDTKDFLRNNMDLVTEKTANYLSIWCLELAMADSISLMDHVSVKVIQLQFLFTMAKETKRNPKDMVLPFFDRLADNNNQAVDGFWAEVDAFRGRIKKRAAEKLEEMKEEEEVEEEKEELTEEELAKEREERLGPGGLDPFEVINQLPSELAECFSSRSLDQLQGVLQKMHPADASKYMKMATDSGLWIPQDPTVFSDTSKDGDGEKVEELEQ